MQPKYISKKIKVTFENCFLLVREAAIWELEERHLQEKHQLLKQQLKDQYFMQRHQLLKRHEKVNERKIYSLFCSF